MRRTDRFIPKRHIGMDSITFGGDNAAPPCMENDILAQDIHEAMKETYRKKLRASLNLPINSNGYLFPRSNATRSDLSMTWPVKYRKKPTIRTPDCALDLPEFKAMYYFNLLDWGSTGYLAAALSWSVFLCHPDTNKTIHLTDIDNPHFASVGGGEYGTSVKWDASGINLAIGTSKSNIQIWNTQTRKLLGDAWCSCSYGNHCSITSLIWSSCNTYLVSGCSHGKLSFILSPGRHTGHFIKAHDGNIITLSCSPDSKYLVSSGSDNLVRIWKWPKLEPYFEIIYDYPAKAVVWHPCRSSLLAVGGGVKKGTITIYNINNCTKLEACTPKKKCVVLSLAWSNYTGELVASYWVSDGLDISSGVGHTEILVLSNLNKVVDKFMVGYQTQVMYLMWNPDGKKIATASADETLRIWSFVPTDMKKSLSDGEDKTQSSKSYPRKSFFSKYILR